MEICSINESFLGLSCQLFSPCLWAESCPVGLAGPLRLFPHFSVADLVSFTLIKAPSRAALESQFLQGPQGQRAAHGCFLTLPGATWLPLTHPPILLGFTPPEEYGLVWAPGVWLVRCIPGYLSSLGTPFSSHEDLSKDLLQPGGLLFYPTFSRPTQLLEDCFFGQCWLSWLLLICANFSFNCLEWCRLEGIKVPTSRVGDPGSNDLSLYCLAHV